MKTTFKSHGVIEFDPVEKTKKHVSQSSWKKVAIINFDCDIHKYYSWFLCRRYNLVLNELVRPPHITFISDRIESEDFLKKYSECKEKYNGTTIKFEYSVDVRSDGLHWWLPSSSKDAQSIRDDIGLGNPHFGFHITIGNASQPIMKVHSEYILDLIKKGFID